MTSTLSRVGTSMYEQSATAEGAADTGEAGPQAEDEATVEGEFREVHNEG